MAYVHPLPTLLLPAFLILFSSLSLPPTLSCRSCSPSPCPCSIFCYGKTDDLVHFGRILDEHAELFCMSSATTTSCPLLSFTMVAPRLLVSSSLHHGIKMQLKITRVSDRKTLRQEVPTILGQQPRTMTPGSPDEIRNSWRDANQRFHADGNYSTFEELVEASGMLDAYPPVPHGESGHSFYTVQPMQLLSWYPRAYLFPKWVFNICCL